MLRRLVGRQVQGPWEVGQGMGQIGQEFQRHISVKLWRKGQGPGQKKGVTRGKSTGRGLGMGTKCGQNGVVYGQNKIVDKQSANIAWGRKQKLGLNCS